MNEHELDLALHDLGEQHVRHETPPDLRRGVRAVPVETPRRRSWLPRVDTRGFGMFSALRLVAAGLIVALFGGFLLAGFLATPHGDERAPAAVSDSPSPLTTEELLSGMVTEEVEPGVYRVIDDGVRDLTSALTLLMATGSPGIVAGNDGSLWIGGGSVVSTAFPLGGDVVELPPGTEGPDFVTPDGTVWAGLWTYDGERWTERPGLRVDLEWDDPFDLGGSVWAIWPNGRTVAHFDGDGWQPLGEWMTEPIDSLTIVDGVLWAQTEVGLSRWHDGQWTRVYEWDDLEAGTPVAIGPDGTVWLHEWAEWPDYTLRAFDGREWRAWTRDEVGAKGYWWVFVDVAPDGGLWAVEQQGWMPVEPGEDPECRGVMRFDGEQLHHFLADACADSFDIGPDGSVWALARSGPADDPQWDLYVITPQAVAASE